MKASFLFLLLLVCASFVQSEQGWVETKISPGVTVAFPAKAEYQWTKREQLYTFATNEVSLSVVVTKLPDHLELTRYDHHGILEGAIHGFSQNAGTMLFTSKKITIGTTTGKEIQYKVKHPMLERYTTGYTRYFIAGRALYAVQCFFLVTDNEQSEQIKEQFFNSINIKVQH